MLYVNVLSDQYNAFEFSRGYVPGDLMAYYKDKVIHNH